ncbi:hypothetical protein N7466_003733 [Penicillium verhagenii]|uniref:uncharacterized protein n=1 Tax=Penicillium verhagenii TaxID=1562060 RepID=UPI00254577E8|nr:uncharacterized protein N7466_003733 [Penicillium verhagenii]KAJ5934186.1 hypothetical protein N7466_003733 [Penicillium verhagenii]
MAETVLLVADVQNGVVDLVLGSSSHKDEYLRRMSTAIIAARRAGVQVIYCVIDLRKGYPEVKVNSALHNALKFMGRFLQSDGSTDIHADIAPQEGDLLVHKRRVSAFVGSDLEIILRSQGIENLIVTGLSTSGVVLSTVRQAADLDFNVTVLEDLCFEMESQEDTHKLLIEKVFPAQATVKTSQAWIDGL